MTKKTMVYPYDQQFLPIYASRLHPADLEFTKFVSPKGWGLVGKDIGEACSDGSYGQVVLGDFDDALADSEVLVICQSDRALDEKFIRPKIEQALEAGKDVHCCIHFPASDLEQFQKLAGLKGATFSYYGSEELDVGMDIEKIIEAPVLLDISTPVIATASISEYSSAFALQVKLVSHLSSLGYTVSVVSPKSYGKFLGHHPCPHFLFEKRHEFEKTLLFNHYISYLEGVEKPDIILMGLPTPLMPLTPKDVHGYGFIPFEMTRTVNPDITMLSIPFDAHDLEHLQELKGMLNARFSLNIGPFVMDNVMIDFADIAPQRSYIPQEVVDQSPLFKSDFPLYSDSTLEKAFQFVIDELAGYADVERL